MRKSGAKEIIDSLIYLTLATVCEDNTAWNSPLYFTRDKDYNFYFGSPKNTVHSQNIRRNGQGFVVIYDTTMPEGTGEGVYFTANIKELNKPNEIKEAFKYMYKDQIDTVKVKDFIDNAQIRNYKITPTEVWMNDAELRNGIYMDYRIKIDLR